MTYKSEEAVGRDKQDLRCLCSEYVLSRTLSRKGRLLLVDPRRALAGPLHTHTIEQHHSLRLLVSASAVPSIATLDGARVGGEGATGQLDFASCDYTDCGPRQLCGRAVIGGT